MNSQMAGSLMIVAAMIIGTQITRFLPFIVFPEGKKTPKFITYLSRTLPYATMGLLVVYCLRGISFAAAPYGAPELLSVALIVILHRLKGNTLLSIGAGTICYMILVQKIF